MGQKRIHKPRTKVEKNTRTEVQDDSVERAEEKRKAINEGMDELLDEIDGVLEENAQDFINSYVQKGGQHHAERQSWDLSLRGPCRARRSYARVEEAAT